MYGAGAGGLGVAGAGTVGLASTGFSAFWWLVTAVACLTLGVLVTRLVPRKEF